MSLKPNNNNYNIFYKNNINGNIEIIPLTLLACAFMFCKSIEFKWDSNFETQLFFQFEEFKEKCFNTINISNWFLIENLKIKLKYKGNIDSMNLCYNICYDKELQKQLKQLFMNENIFINDTINTSIFDPLSNLVEKQYQTKRKNCIICNALLYKNIRKPKKEKTKIFEITELIKKNTELYKNNTLKKEIFIQNAKGATQFLFDKYEIKVAIHYELICKLCDIHYWHDRIIFKKKKEIIDNYSQYLKELIKVRTLTPLICNCINL